MNPSAFEHIVRQVVPKPKGCFQRRGSLQVWETEVHIRLSKEQKAKFKRNGASAWLRKLIDEAPE